jgi:uncharacterized membrane protein
VGSFLYNLAYNNPQGNFKTSIYTTVFIGNSEIPPTGTPGTLPALPTNTASVLSATPSAVPSLVPTQTATAQPIATNTPECVDTSKALICFYWK